MKNLSFTILLTISVAQLCAANLVTYDAPEGAEAAPEYELEVNGMKSRYSKDNQRGKIENVRFNNIQIGGEHFPYSQLLGFDDTYNIMNVALENFYIHGVKINSTYNGMISTIHTGDITFK